MEREQTYELAIKLETQLDGMLDQLTHLVNHLNAKHEKQLADAPSREIMKILNAHHQTLAFLNAKASEIDTSVAALETKLPN